LEVVKKLGTAIEQDEAGLGASIAVTIATVIASNAIVLPSRATN